MSPERFVLIDNDNSQGHVLPGVPLTVATLNDFPYQVTFEAELIAIEFEPGTWKILKDATGPSQKIVGRHYLDRRIAEIQAMKVPNIFERVIDLSPEETLSWDGFPLGEPEV